MSITANLDPITIPALVAAAAEEYGNSTAVSADDGERTFRSLAADVHTFGSALADEGVKPGDRVAVLLPNGVRWLIAVLGAQAAGAVAVPLNTWHTATELADALGVVTPEVVVSTDRALGRDLAAVAGSALDLAAVGDVPVLRWEMGDGLPASMPIPAAAAMETLASRRAAVRESDDAYLLFTSGSSAKPKAVRLIHRDIVRNGAAIAERQEFRRGERLWIASPLFFSMGAVNALAAALSQGVELCIEERYDTERSLDLLERKACSIYYGLPAITSALLASPSFPKRRLALRTGIGAMTAEEKQVAVEQLGVKEMCSVYGLTEAYTLVTMTHVGDPLSVRLATQGDVLPTQEVRITDGVDPLPAGQSGEIEVRGCVTPGYFGGGDSPLRADGWLRTGDRGRLDDHGRLTFEGRMSDVVKTNGILVSPAEVESRLVEHEAVTHALVFGLPDTARGEILGALVVPRNPLDGAELRSLRDELCQALRASLASYKLPRFMWFCDEAQLPLTATEKYDKRAVQRTAVAKGWSDQDGRRVTLTRELPTQGKRT